ncbi:MAG: SDR family NAD(P)-dependent oxidoreductase [Acidobacteriota bacterium]
MSEYGELEGIAVIGMSSLFPNAHTLDEFWRNLANGVESISVLSDEDLVAAGVSPAMFRKPGYVRAACSLADATLFDAPFFAISTTEAEMMDPQHRLFLEYSWAALENAGYNPETYDGEIGVYGGTSMSTYLLYQLSAENGHVGNIQAVLGNDKDYLCTRVSYKLNLRGPSIAVQTACSTSLAAICMACDSLLDHQCSMALAGGVTVKIPQGVGYFYEKGSILSPDGHCRAFDAEAAGTVFGDGVGVVVLKRLSEAVADGDSIYAVIKGSAINNDGSVKIGFTAPSVDGQAKVIAMAHAMADIPPETITYVEAHGTGTPMGDPIEIAALTQAFRAGTSKTGYCAIGSLKTNVGHLESAAGVAGLIKTVLALKHKQLPPSLHYQNPNPEIDFERSPFFVNTSLIEWKVNGFPRRAGVNSFGMGGTNTHVVLEEAPELAEVSNEIERPRHLLCLSARSERAVEQLAKRYEEYLSGAPEARLGDICFTASAGRKHFNHRVAIEAGSHAELLERLKSHGAGAETAGLASGVVSGANEPKIAFLFTGQGSQYAGMGRELYETQPAFRETLDQCQDLLRGHLDRPLLSVMFAEDEATAALLDETEYTQPALFALEYSLARMWQAWGVKPAALLGHSVGEYVAACVAGIFSLEDALRLIATRGRLMQGLPRDGAMATVFAEPGRIRAVLERHGNEVGIAAINGPANTVISGRARVVEEVCRELGEKKIRSKALRVSHAFHSSLIEPMLDAFQKEAKKISYGVPQIPVISNVTGKEEEMGAEYWVRQARGAVRYSDGVKALVRDGVKGCLEIGPKPALTRMASESEEVTRSGMEMWSSLDGRRGEWEVVLETLGRMYTKGVAVDWKGYETGYSRRRVGLPGYPFERQRYWVANTGTRNFVGMELTRKEAKEHELAGWRVKEAWTEEIRYEGELSSESPAYLRDHRVYGEAVVPAAAYLEMMQWVAGKGVKRGEMELEGASFRQALVLKEGERKRIQVVMKAESEGDYALRVYSEETEGDGRWVLHASAKGKKADRTEESEWESLDDVRARCNEVVNVSDLYEMYEGRGLEYGEGFRPIRELWRAEGESLAVLTLPEGLDAEGYRLHPVILDGSLQALGAIFSGKEAGGETFLPVGMKRLRVFAKPGEKVWVHAMIQQGEAKTLTAELRIYSEEGQPVGLAAGLESRRATREAVLQNAQEPMENWLYEVDWRPGEIQASTEKEEAGSWLILSDAGGLGEGLRRALSARGETVTLLRPGVEFNAATDGEITINANSSADYRLVIQSIKENTTRFRGVVNLWSLDPQRSTKDISAAEVENSIEQGCKGTLNLVQALAGAGLAHSPRLWTMTRGTQPIAGPPGVDGVLQSSLWGMTRVVSIENPQLTCTLIDLDQIVQADEGAALLEELLSSDREGEIGYRKGQRYVARLVRYGQARGGASTENLLTIPQQGSYELAAPDTGDLDLLAVRSINRRQPGRKEIEVEVRAISLNFKDVLNAMKLYPGDAGSLGSECAGVVVAVGKDVTDFVVGDEVLVMTPGSFRKHLTVNAVLAVKKPAGLSFEAAATVPVVFLTAYYGLHHLAQLKAGERVLIHAASGGVGMAAIQIARAVGAEIHATASPAKWATLRGLGITHLYNSRTLEFGDQILEATGGSGVDIVLNSLSGDAIEQSFKALSPQGRFIEIGKRGVWSPEKAAEVRPDVRYFSGDLGDGAMKSTEVMRQLLVEVVDKFGRGEFRELPMTIFPIEQAKDAFRLMQQAKHVGKIAMTLPAASIDQLQFDGAASYLVTGGLGGLGLVVSRWMVERGARNLMLVSRRGLRSEQEAAIKEIVEMGAVVRTIAADLAGAKEVARVLSEIEREMPPLKGIVHAAGILDDGVVQNQSWERFVGVLNAKALSGWHLHEQTLGRDLDFFVEFSSVASLLGNAGQSNYAAANAFLDGLAHHRRGLGLPALSINWGGWSEVGMAARQMEGWVSNEMIAPKQGTQILDQLMSQTVAQVGVIPFNWVSYLQQFPIDAEPAFLAVIASEVRQQREGNLQGSLLKQQLKESDQAKRQEMLLEYLQDLVAKLLRLDSSQRPQPSQALSELGLDSLMGIQLKNRLRAELGVDVPIEEFIESPSIRQLADLLLELLLDAEGEGLVSSTAGHDILPAARNAVLPLSFAQQRLWYLEQLETEFPFYNLSFGFQIKGKLDIAVAERALNEIIRRHETLRTSFEVVDGLPVQRIADELKIELEKFDFRGFSGLDQEAKIKAHSAEAALYRFDLSQAPLLRASMLRTSDDEYLLGITMHHIVTDGWSLGIFTSEFAAIYEAFVTGASSPLPELQIQYADFAVWQREWLQGEVLDRQLKYWREKLGGNLPIIDLPTDRPRPAVQTFKGSTEYFHCSEALLDKLNGLSRQENASLYIILLAAFKALIYRYTGQSDILIGSLIANRTRTEVEPLIGFFANMLALRSDITGNPTFRELVARVRDVATGAFAHQDLPFEKLVEELQPERNLNRNPLVQVVFVLQKSSFLPAMELPGVSLRSVWNANDGAVRFDLEVHLWEFDGALSGSFIYNADLFDGATIARMAEHFGTLLEEVVADPEQRIAELQYLSAAERAQLIGMSVEASGAPEKQLVTEGLSDDEVSALLSELLADENDQ